MERSRKHTTDEAEDHHATSTDNIKVYRTDVDDASTAKVIVNAIQRHFRDYEVSLDLEDCAKVLRVESFSGEVNESKIRSILQKYGFTAKKLA